ncbi:MAG: M28 family peptidase [bacterium]
MNKNHHHRFFFLIVSALTFTFTCSQSRAGSKKEAYNFKPARMGLLSITMNESLEHVNALASEEFQGREAGLPGQWLAAQYIANEFSNYGLLPKGDDHKYFQNFQIVQSDLHEVAFSIERQNLDSKEKLKFALKSEFIPFNFTGENTVTAPVVFAGYGITAPEYNYDDYENIDATGKIVLVLRHEPQENDPGSIFKGTRLTRHSLFEVKARNARDHGALAMLLVTDPVSGHTSLQPHGYWPSLYPEKTLRSEWHLAGSTNPNKFPIAWISVQTAEQILENSGKTLTDLQEAIDETLSARSFVIPSLKARLKISLKKEHRKTQNVIGLLEGSDPELRDEVVVMGAHYDHVGVKNGNIYYGADDNASGTAAVLEIAEAFSEMPIRPRRSLLFIAFSAEELGLLGSTFYVQHPSIPLKQTVAMINLDMISRNGDNRVSVIGSDRSPELHKINLAANEEIGLEFFYNGEKYFHRSDQASFAKHKIPVLFYNTEVHEDYHRPTDTPEKVNPEKLARIARLAFLVAWEVANSNRTPTFQRFRIAD